MKFMWAIAFTAVMAMVSAASVQAAEWGLKQGSVDLKSAGQLAFGPDGVLFIGDSKAAVIHAIATGGEAPNALVNYNLQDLEAQLVKTCGAAAQVSDMAANPQTQELFLSVTAGDKPQIVRVSRSGELSLVDLSNVKCSMVELPNAPEDKVFTSRGRSRNNRDSAITDLAYHEGKVMVSGLSNATASSTIREVVFPFAKADGGVSVEIYHGAHGRYEDSAPVQTFVPFNINGEANLLAGYTCTPLVKFPVSELTPGEDKVRGVTVAELGNHNRPLDMIVYEKDGKSWLLMANSARGVIKVSTENIERSEGISEKVKGEVAGQKYDTLAFLGDVTQLDRLGAHQAVVMTENDGTLAIKTFELP
ncbi:hypothetical protein [Lignipirellula cremea]|uniref:Lactonase, 7-bladed beta-propeller n=1 Tax=Lignipirellula cremea TaxID=2528010 RepID=A0A518DTP5_9BACT|nr:hypothetical protein [Lignipirellula cremea]QDU95204.1 hypothetical protein Pla8534_30180 [Lignipirellula cremea]